MFTRLSSLSSLTCIPRVLSLVPNTIRSPILRMLPSLPLSTSAQLRDSNHLVDPHKFPQVYHEVKDQFDGRQAMAKDGYGVTLYDLKDGKRKSLTAVVMRFKRLDWGQWIRPRAGRHKKLWKKSRDQLINNEKHVFCKPYHKRRFDRAVTSDIKEIRHIPDDPYKIYNDMSFQHYHSIKLKNLELIKRYGAKNYNFPLYKAHFLKAIAPVDKLHNPFFEPPNYHSDIASGVYRPDLERPQNKMPPSYFLERRHVSKVLIKKERAYWRALRLDQHWYGRIGPCSPLRLPQYGTKLG